MSPRPRFAGLDPGKSAAILAAAAEEISANGVEGASFNRIIARAGVSKGAMYYYFDDKSDLCQTVVRDAAERAEAAIGELGPYDDAHSFWDALLDLYERITGFLAAEPTLASLLKVVLTQPAGAGVNEVFNEYMQQIEGGFRATLEDGVRLGAVRDDLPVELLSKISFAMGEAMDRWMFAHWDSLSSEDLARVPRDLLSMHMRAIAPLPLVMEWQQSSAARTAKETPR